MAILTKDYLEKEARKVLETITDETDPLVIISRYCLEVGGLQFNFELEHKTLPEEIHIAFLELEAIQKSHSPS